MSRQPRSRAIGPDVALTTLALISSGLVPFGFNLIIGHRYGPAALGEVSVVLGLALFLGQIPGSFTIAATKFLAEALGRGEENAARPIFHFLLVVSVGLASTLAAGLLIAAPPLSFALHGRVGTFRLAAGLIPAYALYLFFKSVYYGIQRVGRYAGNEIASDICFFVALAVVLFLNATPWLLVPFILNNVIFVARAAHDLARYFRHFKWGRGAPRWAILSYCIVAGGGTIAGLSRSSLGTTMAGLYLSHRAVGLYAAAFTLANPLFLLPQALALVLFAAMARLHGAGEAASVGDLLRRSTEWLVVALGVVCGLGIINAAFVLNLLYHSAYVQAATTFQIIVFGAYLSMIAIPSVNALSSTAYIRITTLAALGGFGTSLVAWLLLIPRLGIVGAALGYVIGTAVTGAIPVYFAARLLGGSLMAFLRAGILMVSLAGALLLVGRKPLLTSAIFVGVVALLYAASGSLVLWRRYQNRIPGDAQTRRVRPPSDGGSLVERTAYGRFIRRWSPLIAAGTLLAGLGSYGVVLVHQRSARPSYRSTASVVVHYITLIGAPYNPTLSPHDETVALDRDAAAPAAVRAVARQYHIRLDQITSISSTVEPQATTLDVQVDGTNRVAVDTLAYGITVYLANLASGSIQREARVLQQEFARTVASARTRWLDARARYNRASRRTTDRRSPTLARLQADLTISQQDYQTLASRYAAVGLAPFPAATAERTHEYAIVPTIEAPLNTVLQATLLGFLLTHGLAVLLDYGEPIWIARAGRRQMGRGRIATARGTAGHIQPELDEAGSP